MDKRGENGMNEGFTIIPIELLVFSGRNPRQEMRNLEELAENIKEYGVLQPIIVRPNEEKFEVVVGERRVRASVMAGLKEVPAITRALTDQQTDELRLIENIHREDLTDAEKGDAVLTLWREYPDKYKTIRDVAKSIGTPYSTVMNNWMQKARRLSPTVRQLIARDELGEQQGLLLMKYDRDTQEKLVSIIWHQILSLEETEEFLKKYEVNPTVDLTSLAEEVKGTKRVRIRLAELSRETRDEVEQLLEKRRKETKEKRKMAIKKAREAKKKKKAERRRKPKPPPLSLPEEKQRIEVPKQAILETAETIIERLDRIKHPYQRERMAKIIPKELEKMAKRLERAPERRERVKQKLNRLYELEAEGVFLSTLWDIGKRSGYAGSKDFHGNCPPQVVEQCLLRLTQKGDIVLDPMAGSGTAIDVCSLLDRKCIAYDIKPPEWRNDIIRNDSRKIPLEDNSVDMIFIHPPYWNMVYYTKSEDEGKNSDLSRASTLGEYFNMLEEALHECFRVLKPEKYLCILLGDRINNGRFIPLCRKTANLCEEIGFSDFGYSVKFTRGATSLMVKGKMIYAELAYTDNLKIEHDLVMFFRKEKN